MVPWHEKVVDLFILGVLILILIYAPILRDRPLPLWMKAGLGVLACVLVVGIVHATLFGHWPFRG